MIQTWTASKTEAVPQETEKDCCQMSLAVSITIITAVKDHGVDILALLIIIGIHHYLLTLQHRKLPIVAKVVRNIGMQWNALKAFQLMWQMRSMNW